MFRIALIVLAGLLFAGLLAACTDAGYYVQCIGGHLDVLRRCRPIDELLTDTSLPEARRSRLETIKAARDFASASLALPDNGSYRKFADIGRPYVVWNIVAVPEFSLEPRQWCFPVAGCVSYRGYFDEAAARQEGDRLTGEGYEVDVYGVQAYSTLNWFADPVLNTFLDGPELNAVSLVFHELAHQVVYVPDDSRFNEAFARTVELEGLYRWLRQNGSEADWQKYQLQFARAADFRKLLVATREQLAGLYRSSGSADEKRKEKKAVFTDMERAYADLKSAWGGYAGYDAWMARGLNNARLASVATYDDLVPAFQGLLAASGGDLPAFYGQVRVLAALPSPERLARLDGYLHRLQARAD
jgi:predicted aminopeptidase